MSAAESFLVPSNSHSSPPDTWTLEAIEARRRTGDVLVTRDGWSVGFDTSSETGKVARLSCVRYAPGMSLVVLERDARDGDTFPTTDHAECYALNAGRLQWFRDWKRARVLAFQEGA